VILLTGGTGFIGKYLRKALMQEYGPDRILVLSSGVVEGCPFLLHHGYSFDEDYFVRSGYADIHTIIHAGAYIPKSGAQANRRKECNGNIYSTDQLLSANFPSLKKIIYLSTVDVYGNADVISEQSLIQPVSLYGYSKLYCEKMVELLAGADSKVCQILRVGHVYGPGEEAYQKIIPATIARLQNNLSPQIWGTGKEMRSFIFIDDVIQSIIRSIELASFAGPINIVGSRIISISTLINELLGISGLAIPIEYLPERSARRDLVFDNTRMRDLLKVIETPLSVGLKKEWDYMKTSYPHADIL